MPNFKDVVYEYIDKKVKDKREKEQVAKLLVDGLKKYLDKEQIPYNFSLESLKTNEDCRTKLSDGFDALFNGTTRNKENVRKRIIEFTKYLKETHGVEIILHKEFEREVMSDFERKIDLLRTLNDGKTKKELIESYNISSKPLTENIDELICGTKILGQKVNIRDIQGTDGKISYQSSIHPIFLPLNLTEVYFLIIGLKSLSNDHDAIGRATFDHLANRIYCQLSEYARQKIYDKGTAIGMYFPEEEEFESYNKSRDEGKVATDIDNTLAYVWKSGIKCSIQFKNEEQSINDCYVDYDMNEKEIYFKYSLHGKRERKIDVNQILNIIFHYM